MTLPGGTETLLIVDDDPGILETSRLMLENLGYQVIAKETGEDVLTWMEAESSMPDCVLCDMSMPDMNGRELIEKMREAGYKGPIVVMSGYVMDESDLPEGVAELVVKPYRIQNLARILRDLLQPDNE